LKKLARSLGYEVQGARMTPRQLLDPQLRLGVSFDDVICRRMYERGPALNFIQVGAFDGLIQDPLRDYIVRCGWRGVMIEPQPRPAQKLRELYKDDPNITVLQAALDRQPGSRPFFSVDAPDAPAWAGALASFQKEVILKHTGDIPGLEAMIHEVDVDCVTFDTVLGHLPGDIDVLQIDTEGADAFILSLFPFERVKPAIIHWEVRHLSLREREECLGRLASFGYRFAPSGTQDMLAVLGK
jgi:FkbM family methyltransferase